MLTILKTMQSTVQTILETVLNNTIINDLKNSCAAHSNRPDSAYGCPCTGGQAIQCISQGPSRIGPQLFFDCTLCPTSAMDDSGAHKHVSLVFFSTFEQITEISLTPDSYRQRKGAPMLCTNGLPIKCQHYVCPVENVLPVENVFGRVPLLPCYLKRNTVNTIPYSCRSQIPRGATADSRPDSGAGSRLFEVNIWMWQYGRPFQRKFSVEEAVAMRKKRVQEFRAREAATLQLRREAAA